MRIIELSVFDSPLTHEDGEFCPNQLLLINGIKVFFFGHIRVKVKIIHEIRIRNRIVQRTFQIRGMIQRSA